MARLGGTFDSDQVEPSQSRDPLPAGWYAMQIVASEIKESKNKPENSYLELTLEIDETRHPELSGRRAWARLNLWNSNPTASEIAQGELSAICRSTHTPQIQDSEELHFKPLAVHVAFVEATDTYSAKNEIKAYDTIEKRFGGAPAAQATNERPAPAPNKAPGSMAPKGEAPPWS